MNVRSYGRVPVSPSSAFDDETYIIEERPIPDVTRATSTSTDSSRQTATRGPFFIGKKRAP